jgi:hypothetical protein
MAVKFKIPLIIWGAHQGIDQVGMFSHLDEVEMTRKYRKEHDLMGYEAEDLIDEFDGITKEDIVQYVYPDDKEIERIGVRGIYLNNYLRWDSKAQHEQMIKDYKYESISQTRTFDTYNDVDCYNYSDVHDYIKFIKHGYGKVTDHASREIRLRRMTREEGLELVKSYNQISPKNYQLFFDWLGITENSFNYIIDQHRSKKVWKRNENWEWELHQNIFSNIESEVDVIEKSKLPIVEQWKDFELTLNQITPDKKNQYIIIGKGFPNPDQ